HMLEPQAELVRPEVRRVVVRLELAGDRGGDGTCLAGGARPVLDPQAPPERRAPPRCNVPTCVDAVQGAAAVLVDVDRSAERRYGHRADPDDDDVGGHTRPVRELDRLHSAIPGDGGNAVAEPEVYAPRAVAAREHVSDITAQDAQERRGVRFDDC